MSSAVAELESILQSMLALKPPGVSGTKIGTVAALCTANIQSESVLVQKIYTHFKKAPGTHKLGVLYVVDSVTRKWVEQARKNGQQPVEPGAPDGTFAAGINRVTELLPVLMTDIINTAPEDQKDKIKKLVDIWERGQTFPAAMLNSFKAKFNASAHNVESTTPENSPAPGFVPLGQPDKAPEAAAPNTSAILAALANMAKQNTPTPATAQAPPPPPPSVPALQHQNNLPTSMSYPMTSSVESAPGANAAQNFLSQFGLNGTPAPLPVQAPAPPVNPLAALFPQMAVPTPAPAAPAPVAGMSPDMLQQQLQLIQLLAAQGIPQDQWASALQLLQLTNGGGAAPAAGLPNFGGSFPQAMFPGAHNDNSRGDYRSPQDGYRRRSRSRSPGGNWDRSRHSPPNRRDSPVYGEYDRGRGIRGGRGGAGGYRERSPPGRRGRRTPSPAGGKNDGPLPPPHRYIEFDPNLGNKSIKVLSRTLFVGGVTTTEAQLRPLFQKFGYVQTCIVNLDKRHAFVKMVNRKDAIAAREGMESYRAGDMQLRTRWGVGFGPRDCSDYQTGVSVIPIDRLTDADRKWLSSAEYGGTGGKPLEGGMVVEEPDIEIGAGVSSKAISRRMATDTGGKRGPTSTRPQGGVAAAGNPNHEPTGARFRRDHQGGGGQHGNHGAHGPGGGANYHDRDAPTANVGVPPAVPGFGFQFAGGS